MISCRAQSIDVSGIRRVFDLAAGLKSPVNLSIGQPSFDVLEPIKGKMADELERRRGGYTVTQGIPEVREGVRRLYELTSKSGDLEVIITAGVSGGFSLAYMSILDPGDEVLIPDPFFGMYRDAALLLNAVPKYYDLYPDYLLPLDQIESQITPRTKAVVVNNPGNPTGKTYTQAEIDQLIAIVQRRGIWLIYDEIYSVFTYDHPPAKVLGSYDKLLLLNGFSKSHGIPGWRMGWAIGPKDLIGAMGKLQQYTFVCSPSIVQWSVVDSLDYDFTAIRDDYRAKRDFVYESLKDRYRMVHAGGAYYLFPEAPGGSGQKFFERCLEQNLLLVPGHCFSRRDTHFRLSFSASRADLERGVEILRSLA